MAGKERVLIGCRLPSGLVLHSVDRKKEVKLDGAASSKVIGSSFALTSVDAEFWGQVKPYYQNFINANVLFEARGESDAIAKGKELQKEETGFEQMPQEALGVQPDKAAA